MMNLQHLMETMLPLSAAEATLWSECVAEPRVSDLVPPDIFVWALDRKLTHAMARVYRPLAPLVERYRAGLWIELLQQYATEAAPEILRETTGKIDERQLEAIGPGFVRYLERRRIRGADQARWIEECAEYLACQLRAATADDPFRGSDGLETRLFIRRYRCDVDALLADPRHCELPQPGDEPTIRVIFRSWSDGKVYLFEPRPVHLFAISRRSLVASDLGGRTATIVDEAERWLVAHGVLLPGE